jgi:hypothetical protein
LGYFQHAVPNYPSALRRQPNESVLAYSTHLLEYRKVFDVFSFEVEVKHHKAFLDLGLNAMEAEHQLGEYLLCLLTLSSAEARL